MRETRRERSPRMETSPKETAEELLEKAFSGLESIESDIERINIETPPERIKIFWKEAEYTIEWLEKAAEKLINEGIEMRKGGALKQGGEEIRIGIRALTRGLSLRERIIKSGERVKGFTEKARTQKKKQREYLRRFLYLVLKAEILGYENRSSSEIEKEEIRNTRDKIKGKLEAWEQSLAETEEGKKRASQKLNKQIKEWEKELKNQRNNTEAEGGSKTNGFY